MMLSSEAELRHFLSIENFELAWRRIQKSPRVEVKDRLSLKIYSANTRAHLLNIIEQLSSKMYAPEPIQRIYTPKNNGTLRAFPFLSMQDRIVYQAIGNIIHINCYDEMIKHE